LVSIDIKIIEDLNNGFDVRIGREYKRMSTTDGGLADKY